MSKVIALLALAGSAAAFVPAASSSRSPVAPSKGTVFEEYVGGEGGYPGMKYEFDPMGLAESNPDAVPWFREAELKHGRVCMLATIGMIVPHFYTLPQYKGLTVLTAHEALVKTGAMQQLLIFIGLFETVVGIPAAWATIKGERAAGDFAFGTAFIPEDPALYKRKKLSELKNGRLAMLAFSGMVTQAALTGNDFPFLF